MGGKGGGGACEEGALDFDSVHEREGGGDFLERAADEGQVEPCAGEPCGEVCEQRAADAADLFYGEQAAAQQAQRDEEQRGGQVQQDGVQDGDRDRQAENDGQQVAHDRLRHGDGDHGQDIAEDKVRRLHGGGIQALEERGFAVARHEGGGEQRHERQAEHRDAGRKAFDFENRHGHVGLNGAHQQNQRHGEAEAEGEVQRVAQDFFCGAPGEGQHSHFDAPLTMAINASSNFSCPV